MQFDIISIFPDFFAGPLDYGIVRRAREAQRIEVRVHDLRAYAHDRHRTVDDRPFGGGEGMVLKPEPLFEAVESLLGSAVRHEEPGVQRQDILDREIAGVPGSPQGAVGNQAIVAPRNTAVVLLSASGKLFRQETARRFAQLDRLILLCGRYEGVDERVAEHLATDELSIGDYVLSGGELGAALVLDAVTRLLPGALGNEASSVNESFSDPVFCASQAAASVTYPSQVSGHLRLDFPHYTRPADFRGWPVPEVLLGGNHEEIRRWRREQSLEKTRRNRPDLLAAEQRNPRAAFTNDDGDAR
jgi:tRNA (guanine37-N1)-methyltransferase